MTWRAEYKSKLVTPEYAASFFNSGDVIGMGGGTGIPSAIGKALGARADELENITICQGFATALHDYMLPQFKGKFQIQTIFVGPAERMGIEWGTLDFVPNHLGSMVNWAEAVSPTKGAFVVTPPDERGYMNLSLFAGLVPRQVRERFEVTFVEVNRHTPWLVSDDFQIHVSEVTGIVENDVAMFEVPEIPITDVEERIAHIIADMVPDGATIQLGLGGLANAVGHFLKEKRHLGIHSEVFSNSIMELLKCGAADNSRKSHMPGKSVYTFSVGTRELYDYIDKNEDCVAFEIAYTNDPNVIAKNDNMVSVNSTLMVDLVGQVASESIGTKQYSATGGQVNFVLGAQKAKNGKSILALQSTFEDKNGKLGSRILPTLPAGTVVTTSRNDVQWIVTEYGAVYLSNKPISHRVKSLISIAHPDFRDQLTFEAKKIGWI
ncbi:MAG: acetyl-CoA hydrolase/transferase family protein [Solirubrobacterales bacterium]